MYSVDAVGNHQNGASPYGALDLAGNVWEWVYDWYQLDYYQFSPTNNPLGPESGTYKVLRGGSFRSARGVIRASNRTFITPDYRDNARGFRCSR
jgi:formylglycine-generating enzyme required for sulfatase activity